MTRGFNPDEVLSPGQVAEAFGVDPKTVSRWAEAGLLPYIRTPGGHKRYLRGAIEALLTDVQGGRNA